MSTKASRLPRSTHTVSTRSTSLVSFPRRHSEATYLPLRFPCKRVPPHKARERLAGCPAALQLAQVLDGMVSVMSSRTGRESPLRSAGYLQMRRGLGPVKSCKLAKVGKKMEIGVVPSKEVFAGMYEAVSRPRTGKKLYELMKALGYDLDQQLFHLLLDTYLQAKPGQELTCEDWITLLSGHSVRSRLLPLPAESRFALISAVKYEVSKANSDFLCVCATWNRLAKTETGETARFSAVQTISDLYSIPNSEVNAKIEELFGRGWTLSEEKYLNLLLPLVLQRTFYEVGMLIYAWGSREGSMPLGRLIRGLADEIQGTNEAYCR